MSRLSWRYNNAWRLCNAVLSDHYHPLLARNHIHHCKNVPRASSNVNDHNIIILSNRHKEGRAVAGLSASAVEGSQRGNANGCSSETCDWCPRRHVHLFLLSVAAPYYCEHCPGPCKVAYVFISGHLPAPLIVAHTRAEHPFVDTFAPSLGCTDLLCRDALPPTDSNLNCSYYSQSRQSYNSVTLEILVCLSPNSPDIAYPNESNVSNEINWSLLGNAMGFAFCICT